MGFEGWGLGETPASLPGPLKGAGPSSRARIRSACKMQRLQCGQKRPLVTETRLTVKRANFWMTWAVSSPVHSEITNLARDRGARAVKARLQRQAHKRLTAHLHLWELCSCLTLSGIPRSHETGDSAGHAAVRGTQGSGRQTLDTGLARRAKGPGYVPYPT